MKSVVCFVLVPMVSVCVTRYTQYTDKLTFVRYIMLCGASGGKAIDLRFLVQGAAPRDTPPTAMTPVRTSTPDFVGDGEGEPDNSRGVVRCTDRGRW